MRTEADPRDRSRRFAVDSDASARLRLLTGLLVLPGLVAAALLALVLGWPDGPVAGAAQQLSTPVIAAVLGLFAVAVALSVAIARGLLRPAAALTRSLDDARTALRESEGERRALERELEQRGGERMRQFTASEALLRAFFDNSPDSLALVRATPDGRFTLEDLNPAFEAVFRSSRERLIGQPIEAILGAEAAKLPLYHLREILRTGEIQRYTARRTTGDLTRTIDVTYVRIPGATETGDCFIATAARDVTEREHLEDQLRQAQKMEAVGQLTGGVAHDFNNLLTAIVGNLELAQLKRRDRKALDRALDSAIRVAESGAKLTQQLLAFSRRQHLQQQSIDVGALLLRLRDMIATTIGGLIRVDIHTTEVWPILADPNQLELALLNLAINARDAMPEGGTLSIRTANIETPDGGRPADLAPGNYVRISVGDTGDGMSEDIRDKAFEPFFTTKEPGKGSGLGLSQVYGFARQSGGTVQLDSAVGRGTTVSIFLPRAIGDEGQEARHRERIAADAGGARILLVDDDDDVRKVASDALAEAGYAVVPVRNGFEALDLLARDEMFDLMLADFAMPGMSGIALYEEARLRRPTMRALFMTGFAEALELRANAGMPPVIKKPFRLAELVAAVSDRLADGTSTTTA
ncbi:MAG: response regulator [Alphaproteobacteria bacterium]|nr:response regulator [Alphaproteobacteria bacterium]